MYTSHMVNVTKLYFQVKLKSLKKGFQKGLKAFLELKFTRKLK